MAHASISIIQCVTKNGNEFGSSRYRTNLQYILSYIKRSLTFPFILSISFQPTMAPVTSQSVVELVYIWLNVCDNFGSICPYDHLTVWNAFASSSRQNNTNQLTMWKLNYVAHLGRENKYLPNQRIKSKANQLIVDGVCEHFNSWQLLLKVSTYFNRLR